MKLVYKIIYWCALAFIVLTIMVWLVAKLIPLEFRELRYEDYFATSIFIGIPVAIMTTITRVLFKARDRKSIWNGLLNRFFLAVLYFVFAGIYVTTTWGDGMCNWSTSKTLFENKQNAAVKLVARDFGCGVLGNDQPVEGFFIQTSITPFFFYYSPADTTKIDMHIWRKVH